MGPVGWVVSVGLGAFLGAFFFLMVGSFRCFQSLILTDYSVEMLWLRWRI